MCVGVTGVEILKVEVVHEVVSAAKAITNAVAA
jgi:hypothetical protein